MAAIVQGNTLTLSGYVGDVFSGEYFSHTDVVIALAEIGDDADLTVYLNSGGGYTDEGAAIHAMLDRRAGRTDVVIEGIAASAASLIAMVGHTVTMAAGSLLMIHDPSVMTIGNADHHGKAIEGLDAVARSWAQVYARKSGKTPEECRAIMKAERWYAPDDAVSEGFADLVGDAEASPVAAFDYRVYAHAPQQLRAIASQKNWRVPVAKSKSTATRKETAMSGRTASAGAHVSATARIKAIVQAPEAEGRAKLAEHLAFDTALDAEAAIAVMNSAPTATAADSEMTGADYYELDRLRAIHETSRPHGAGLSAPYAGARRAGGGDDIVAAMKRRHGVE